MLPHHQLATAWQGGHRLRRSVLTRCFCSRVAAPAKISLGIRDIERRTSPPSRGAWRSCRVPEDLEQIVDRREISILRSGRREGFALPRDRCSVSRAFRATGALSKTPVLRGHLDNLIFSRL